MSTMLESFDSQMFDYQPDIDVQMDPSSADPWIHQEDIVLDDPLSPGKYTELPGGAEIEMTDDNDTEYEMTDDPQMNSVANPLDVVDVEVADVSHAPTPMNHDSPALAPQSPQAEQIFISQNQPEAIHSSSTVSTSEYPPEHPGSPHLTNTDIHSMKLVSKGDSLPDGSQASTAPEEKTEPAVVEGLRPIEESAILTLSDDPGSTDSAVDEISGEPEIDTVHELVEQVSSGLTGQDHVPLELPLGDAAQNPLSTEAEAPDQQEPVGDQVDENDTDPHEISEGVYIEPPPAVFLSLSSLGCPDVSLFSHPLQAARTSPHSDHSTPDDLPALLFEHGPTLYYEPLSNVFQALREDGCLAGLATLSHEELVLDAYDLDLILPEDNVYSREVSLHDLNVLHDGCEFAGPLRLSLRTTSPRFSIRYHALQEQVSRAQLVTEALEQQTEATDEDVIQRNKSHGEAEDSEVDNGEGLHLANRVQALDPQDGENETSNEADTSDALGGSKAHEADLPVLEEEERTDLTPLLDEGPQAASEEAVFNTIPADEGFEEENEQDNLPDEEYLEPQPEDPGEIEDHHTAEEHTAEEHPEENGGSEEPEKEGAVNVFDYSEQAQEDFEPIAGSSRSTGAEDLVPSEPAEESYNNWEDEIFDGENNPDLSWEVDAGEHDTESNQSSITLRSHASKRSFDELEEEDELQDGEDPTPSSPGSKRARVE